MAFDKTALQDNTRRWARTTYQAFLVLVLVIPVAVELLKGFVEDVFGIDSVVYGRVVAIGATATLVLSALVRVQLALESRGWIPSFLTIAKKNAAEAEPVAVVQTDSSGVIQSVEMSTVSETGGRHSDDDGDGEIDNPKAGGPALGTTHGADARVEFEKGKNVL